MSTHRSSAPLLSVAAAAAAASSCTDLEKKLSLDFASPLLLHQLLSCQHLEDRLLLLRSVVERGVVLQARLELRGTTLLRELRRLVRDASLKPRVREVWDEQLSHIKEVLDPDLWPQLEEMQASVARALGGATEAHEEDASNILAHLAERELDISRSSSALQTIQAFGIDLHASDGTWLCRYADELDGCSAWQLHEHAAGKQLCAMLRDGADPFELRADGESLVSFLADDELPALYTLLIHSAEWPQLLLMLPVRVVDGQGRTLPQLLVSQPQGSPTDDRSTLMQLFDVAAPTYDESYALLSQWLCAALTRDVADIAMQYFAGVKCKPADATAADAPAAAAQSSPASAGQQ